jgi:hypothetical protein
MCKNNGRNNRVRNAEYRNTGALSVHVPAFQALRFRCGRLPGPALVRLASAQAVISRAFSPEGVATITLNPLDRFGFQH